MKGRFFAQYWGQKVLMVSKDAIAVQFVTAYFFQSHFFEDAILLLKPLLLISDEDAIEVVEIVKALGIVSSAMREPQKFLEPMKQGKGTTHVVAPVVDYLRSKGYALPYLNYSVQDLVLMGWIKLTES